MKRRIAGLVCAVLLWPMFAFAQATGTGTVTGRVVDSSGAVLPGVTVTMKSPQALGQFTGVTDAQGLYRIANLPPAAHEARAELRGFQTVVQPVTVRVATTLPVDFTLAVGAMSETVNVTAETPDRRSGTVGLVDQHQQRGADAGADQHAAALSGRVGARAGRVRPSRSGGHQSQRQLARHLREQHERARLSSMKRQTVR